MRIFRPIVIAALVLCWTGAAAQGVLRIGLSEDPDTLDPMFNRLAVGRQPMTAICDKLFDVSQELSLVPQLATGYQIAKDGKSVTLKLRPGVKFQDGEVLDANAVRFNLDRYMNTPGSYRRVELDSIERTETVDPLTVRIVLKKPQANLLLLNLAERAGMMVSPKAAKQLGDRFGTQPVCAGEYRFVERVPQGRIVVERFADYWDKDKSKGGLARIEYLPITDSTVRLSSLRSGEIQIAERLTASDVPQLASDKSVRVESASDLGYQFIRYNSANGPRGKLFSDVRVRHAVDLAIDRKALVKALFEDRYQAGNQFVNPNSQYYDKTHPVPARDVAGARKLLKEAGVPNFTFTLLVPAERERQEVAQLIQAMLAEAGITMNLETQENALMLQNAPRGQFEAILSSWSGRPHPDGNVYAQLSCNGPQNDGKYCDPALDAVLNQARETTSDDERRDLYRKAAGMVVDAYPMSVLYHRRTFTGVSAKLVGFEAYPDTTIRVKGLRLK
jgi:peptide/nickel transport system substrate-binding protein